MKKFTEITDIKECFEITGLPDAKTIAEIPEEFHEEMLADYRTKVMAKCANSLSKPGVPIDWSNHNQRKHFPVFEMLSSGSVDFLAASYRCSIADAGDASRRAFLDESDTRHAATTWPEEFNTALRK